MIGRCRMCIAALASFPVCSADKVVETVLLDPVEADLSTGIIRQHLLALLGIQIFQPLVHGTVDFLRGREPMLH